MRSHVRKNKSLWLGCLLITMACCPALAASSGEITQVKLEPQDRRIVIASKGTVGKHLARVIGQPNRLVMDFENMTVGKVPPKITGDKTEIREIRVNNHKSRARIVVDFQDHPVPPFQVRRGENEVFVIFGNSLAAALPGTRAAAGSTDSDRASLSAPVAPDVVTTAAKVPSNQKKARGLTAEKTVGMTGDKRSAAGSEKAQGSWNRSAGESKAKHPALKEVKLAQSMDLNKPQPSSPIGKPSESTSEAARPPARGLPGPARPGQGGPQMVREVRPPVTPPTPDPRLVVQEITELKFIQVGHNARLVVRGGDNMDYRLNKVSPTKARLDLVNAEIPKAYQKPLKTDLFSTSVEMIVPGSQTIFIQLKDAVPYQVEKKKGVLMIDFPPPRFSASPDHKVVAEAPGAGDLAGRQAAEQSRETRMQAFRIMREEEVRKENETRRRNIESLQKQQEELQKQRTEILKRYQVTTDPEIFNKPVTMDFQGISLRNAFRLLAEQAGINIIVGNEVTGTTTVRLFQVPLGQVIDTILNTHDLDREMMGNVMRIGKKTEMQKYKQERLKEYERRIKEVDTRLANIGKEVQKEQDTSEKALKELEKKEAGLDERVEDTRAEEYGEAGCVTYKDRGEQREVCFYYATVKLVYAKPADVVNTLDCMFNLQCAGARQRGQEEFGGPAGPSISTPPTGAVVGSTGTTLPSSTPGLPTQVIVQQQQQQQTVDALQRQGQAQERYIDVLQRGGRSTGKVTLPPGSDPMLLAIVLNNMLAPDTPNRMIFIKDTSERIAQMKKVIATLDVPTPQVLIEGRIVEATKAWSRGLGVLWGGRNNQNGPIVDGKTTYWGITGNQAGPTANTATGQTTSGNDIPSSFAVNIPATVTGITNLMGLGMQFGLLGTQYITELDARINFGEHNDDLRVIARPKVQVLDNQKATIKKGQTIPYTTISANGTQTQLVNADLLLEVTPRIFADGRVSMKIKMTDDSPASAGANPNIITQEAETNMIVKDGETAVIGGIIRNSEQNTRDGWPGLMNIPVVNIFFTNKFRDKHLDELLVFVTPIIIKRPPPAS